MGNGKAVVFDGKVGSYPKSLFLLLSLDGGTCAMSTHEGEVTQGCSCTVFVYGLECPHCK